MFKLLKHEKEFKLWLRDSTYVMATHDNLPKNNGKYYDVKGVAKGEKTHYTEEELFEAWSKQRL